MLETGFNFWVKGRLVKRMYYLNLNLNHAFTFILSAGFLFELNLAASIDFNLKRVSSHIMWLVTLRTVDAQRVSIFCSQPYV